MVEECGVSPLLIFPRISDDCNSSKGPWVHRIVLSLDLIVGISTDGIFSPLLGRMRMSVDRPPFMLLARTTFKSSAHITLSHPTRGQRILDRGSIGDIVDTYLGDRDAPLDDTSTD